MGPAKYLGAHVPANPTESMHCWAAKPAYGPGIDDIEDAVQGEAGLRNIGGHLGGGKEREEQGLRRQGSGLSFLICRRSRPTAGLEPLPLAPPVCAARPCAAKRTVESSGVGGLGRR